MIDLITFDKVDIFVMTEQPWSRLQLERRRQEALTGEPAAPVLYFASPEDVIISKLVWYRGGGEISDRQWLDILNMLALQAGNLDWVYLRQWANELGVGDLLVRASEQSGPDIAPEGS